MSAHVLSGTSISIAAFITAATLVSPARAQTWISDGARQSNSYQTYAPGRGGCVDDLGYGRTKNECNGGGG